jgi:tetratricopeptide (TPR) repeat protein
VPIDKIKHKHIWLIIFVGSFVLYGNTLTHQYALDDAIVITQNEFTKQGVDGIFDILKNDSFTGFFGKQKKLVAGGRYRPLSVITFALEHELFGTWPGISHLINVLLYALSVGMFFQVLYQLLLKHYDQKKTLIFAIITVVLFWVHPLHTEVVANIKGRDEILSVLFSLVALWLMVKSGFVFKLLAILSLFLALLSKENAMAFVFIIPLAGYFFIHRKIKESFIQFSLLLIPALGFLLIRQHILGAFSTTESLELMNNPFLGAGIADKYATIFYTWFVYLKLLIFPHPLTFDYYPYHITLQNFTQWKVWFVLIFIAFFVILGIKNFKRDKLVLFSILGFAFAFAPVSNLFFPVGTFMNERFLFMPGLFWSILLAWFLFEAFRYINNKRLQYIFASVLFVYFIGFYSVKTIARNNAWHNDFILFTTDVKTSFDSAKSTCSAGGKLWEEAKTLPEGNQKQELYQRAESYLRQSVSIHPKYADAWLLLGNVLFDAKKDVPNATNCFLKVLRLQSQHANAWQNFDIVLQQTNDRNLQMDRYLSAYQIDSDRYIINYRLGVLYGRYFNNLPLAISYLKKAIVLDSTQVGAYKDLGTALGIYGDKQGAYAIFKKALSIDSTDVQLYQNVITACMQLNLNSEAQNYMLKIKQLETIQKAN